jgi:serine/threonine protein kinase
MGNGESVPPLGRLIAMLSAFGMTPNIDDPSTPSGAATTESEARRSDSSPRPGRKAFLRPSREDSHPECVLGPDEHELLRLLEEIAREPHPLRQMPRESSSFGRYMVLNEIDRGGSGVIYLGTDPELDRPVVLKVARPETLDDAERLRRFDFEGKVASRLDHPNIVPVHEVGEVDGLPYIAMAYVEGGTLADWLLGDEPATPRQASRLVREIAGAVGYAHDRGILNLDLKPRNVMLRPVTPASPEDLGVVPLVIDFGLARPLDGGDEAMDGMALVGTPPYMAPEQVREGSRGCGRTADVHALGVILYELLVGWPPFLGENRLQTIRAVVEDEPVPPRLLRPSVPPELEAICLKCLEKSPDRRYSTAHELYDELGRFLEGGYAPTRSMAL